MILQQESQKPSDQAKETKHRLVTSYRLWSPRPWTCWISKPNGTNIPQPQAHPALFQQELPTNIEASNIMYSKPSSITLNHTNPARRNRKGKTTHHCQLLSLGTRTKSFCSGCQARKSATQCLRRADVSQVSAHPLQLKHHTKHHEDHSHGHSASERTGQGSNSLGESLTPMLLCGFPNHPDSSCNPEKDRWEYWSYVGTPG